MGAAKDLSSDIVTFLEAHDGRAATPDIVGHFQQRVDSGQMPLFRQLLKQVASLQRERGTTLKLWVLKPEFVPDHSTGDSQQTP